MGSSPYPGRLLGVGLGNPAYKYQTASVGKAFSPALVGLAVEAGLIQPDDL